ncbi:MAG: A/G-specific adenine glycosylase [Candidatus Moraniibacteriota bacterium]|nr:MAG: A/G-specific adenine glycosylase [Candidatus Moranbacteria bacterium]
MSEKIVLKIEKKQDREKFSQRKILSFFVKELISFYEKNKRDLPWRRSNISPYEVWVSEIMLQQTQVSRVEVYYKRFLEKFPTLDILEKTSWEDFLPYYQGLGYYRRGRNMLHTAKKIISQHDGNFPLDLNELEKLPGVGAYTARAIASFSNDEKVLAWDTNFSKVFGRFFLGSKDGKLLAKDFERKIFEILSLSKNKNFSFKDINSAVMDFGSLVCVKSPKCEPCSLKRHCTYFLQNGLMEEKSLQKKENFPSKEASAYVILHENHKKYFSSSENFFRPFMFSSPYTNRPAIKDFFEKKYGLVVAVRPPKMKLFVKDIPVFVIYAQILSGEHNFSIFSGEIVRAKVNTWL